MITYEKIDHVVSILAHGGSPWSSSAAECLLQDALALDQRKRCFLAVKMASTGKINGDQACLLMQVSRNTTSRLKVALSGATPEETREIWDSRANLTKIYNRTAQPMRRKAEISNVAITKDWYESVTKALLLLSNLPLAADVAKSCKSYSRRAFAGNNIDKKLRSAAKWLREFENEWIILD